MEWRQGATGIGPVRTAQPFRSAPRRSKDRIKPPAAEVDVLLTSADAPQVSVIVSNNNGEAFLRPCLQSLAVALTGIAHEIIVVDNASSDASCDMVSREFPHVRLLRSECNLGIAGGSNLGARHARGELLLLLGPDTQCQGSLANLVAVMRDRSLGAAGCMLRYADGRVRPSIGFEHTPLRVVLSWLGLARFARAGRCFKRVESRAEFYQHFRSEIDWVSGACLLTRRLLWKRLGGFDESFFMACEDIDYCRRVRQAGYSIAYAPASAVMHYEATGRTWALETLLLRTSRSYLLYMSKHFGTGVRTLVGLGLGAVFLARSACYALASLDRANRLAREKFRAYARAAVFLFGAGIGLRKPGSSI